MGKETFENKRFYPPGGKVRVEEENYISRKTPGPGLDREPASFVRVLILGGSGLVSNDKRSRGEK